MAVEFHMHIPNPEDVPPGGKPLTVAFDFKGMTREQAVAAQAVFQSTSEKFKKLIQERYP